MILTSKNCIAKITIRAGGRAKSLYLALAPDMDKLQEKDERLGMSLHGPLVTFSMETNDLASLRANVNSYLRLADASLKSIENTTL